MANAWSSPHHQQDQIPSTSNGSGPAGQIATQRDVDNIAQSCLCSLCSRSRYDHQAARPTGDYQNLWLPTNPVAPYANQSPGIDDPAAAAGISTIANGQMMVRPVGQQAPWGQENAWYAPRYEAVGFLQAHSSAAPGQAQLDVPVLGNLRRLAEHYFNNPDSLINAVHFEYGPTGRPQVVIALEIADGPIY